MPMRAVTRILLAEKHHTINEVQRSFHDVVLFFGGQFSAGTVFR